MPTHQGEHPGPTFHVDYLGVTIKTDKLDVVASQVINILAVGVVPGLERVGFSGFAKHWRRVSDRRKGGGRGYREIWELPGPVTVYALPYSTEHGEHIHLEAKGEVLTAAGAHALKMLFGMLDGYFPDQWKATRLDLAWDGVPFTPHMCKEAVMGGDLRSWANRKTLCWVENPCDQEQGSTFYLGSRSSERCLRVYDRRGPTRAELELKGERAAAVAALLAATRVRDWPQEGLLHLRDFLDFVDTQDGERPSRASLLSWWSEFVGSAAKAGLKLHRTAVDTVGRVRSWVRKAVAPSLAVLLAVDGGDLSDLLEMAKEGRRRWTGRHRALAAAAAGVAS